ncbi:MAG: ADP-ribosylation factor-like protein [Promethearchaeota archaeon]
MLSDFLRLIKGFVLFIGPSAAGKTSILRRMVTGTFEEHEPTLGFREETISKVRIIEIGGQHSFKKYWKVALDQQPIHIFFIIDVVKEADYSEYEQFINQNQPQKVTLIVNKTDLVTTTPAHIPDQDSIILSSAKNGEGMLDILEAIASCRDEIESKTQPKRMEKNDDDEKEKVESILKEFHGKF